MIGTIGGVALLVPLLSALNSPAIPLGLRLLLIALWAVAIARPHWAIASLTILVPFASWLLVELDAPTVCYAEALVLATLSGACIAASRRRRTPLGPQPPPLAPPALLFGTLVAASAAVMLQVMQTGTHAPWPFVRSFVVFLTRDYLVEPKGSFLGVADAALLLEGIALLFLVARHVRDGVMRPAQVFAATGVAGALAGVLTLTTFVTTALQATSIREFFWRIAFSRMGVHIADVNAAGSFFAMTTLMALAFALNLRHARVPRRPALRRACWAGAAALMLASLWITGSRMAVLTVIAGVCIVATTMGPLRPARWPRWAVAAAAVAATLLLVALAIGLDPRPSATRTASNMLTMRADFMRTGLRMIASAPTFGVGIGRYFEMSGQFMPASIYWFYFHENAHNNFLQIGGELGLAGLAAFVWMLAVATMRLMRGVRADHGDQLLVGACAALGAFVLTWMTSHPMLVPEVAYPFWILLGAAIARADGDAQPASASQPADSRVAQTFRPATVVAALVVVALAVSVPLRAKREIGTLDFTRQSFGFYDWEGDAAMRFRWTSRRATFFMPLSSRDLRLPLRAIHLGNNIAPTEVTIAIGGRTFHRVVLAEDDWVTVHLRLPLRPDNEGYQRIDIITEPTWSPAALFGGHASDVRVLGVQVGEPVTGP